MSHPAGSPGYLLVVHYDNNTRKRSIDRGMWNVLFIVSTSMVGDDGDAGEEDSDTIETTIWHNHIYGRWMNKREEVMYSMHHIHQQY